MKLRGMYLDNVGRHNGWLLEDLADGLTVVFGANEAGKSTLLASVRGVLFGRFSFADSNFSLTSSATGRLIIEDGRGERTTVERKLAGKKTKAPMVTDKSGVAVAGEAALQSRFPELAEVEDGLYRSVFTFQLSELRPFHQNDGVALARVASPAIFGERSALVLESELDDAAKAIFNPNRRATQPPLSKILREIQRIDGDLRQRLDTPEGLERLRQEQRSAESAERAAKLDLDALLLQRQRIVQDQALLPAHLRLRQIEGTDSNEAADKAETKRLEDIRGRLTGHHMSASGLKERVQRVSELNAELRTYVSDLLDLTNQLKTTWVGPLCRLALDEEAVRIAHQWMQAFERWSRTATEVPTGVVRSLEGNMIRLLALPADLLELDELDDWVERWQSVADRTEAARLRLRDAELELKVHQTPPPAPELGAALDAVEDDSADSRVDDLRDEEEALARDAERLQKWEGQLAESHRLELSIAALMGTNENSETVQGHRPSSKLRRTRFLWPVLIVTVLATLGTIAWSGNQIVQWIGIAVVVIGCFTLLAVGKKVRSATSRSDASSLQRDIRLQELRAMQSAVVDQIGWSRRSLERTVIGSLNGDEQGLEHAVLTRAQLAWREAKRSLRFRQDRAAIEREWVNTNRMLTTTLARRDAELAAQLREQQVLGTEWSTWLQRYHWDGVITPVVCRSQWLLVKQIRAVAATVYERVQIIDAANGAVVTWLYQLRETLALVPPDSITRVDGLNLISQLRLEGEAPVSEAPVSEAPVSEAPVSEAPVNEANSRVFVVCLEDLQIAEDVVLATLKRLGQRIDERVDYQRARDDARIEVAAICGGFAKYEMERPRLDSLSADQLAVALEEVEQKMHDVQTAQQAASRRHGEATSRIRELEQSTETQDLLWERADLQADRDRYAAEWATLKVSAAALRAARERLERDRRPEALVRAAERFSQITDGRYRDLFASVEPGQPLHLSVLDAEGRHWNLEQLSRGTREQIYFALRIALIEEYQARGTVLPVILDDPLVNFDGPRFDTTFRILNEAAQGHQFIYLTCHAEILEAASRTDGTNVVIL